MPDTGHVALMERPDIVNEALRTVPERDRLMGTLNFRPSTTRAPSAGGSPPLLRAGDLVVLTGPLGAGKTALAQGVGRRLESLGAVTSPTFVIARVHQPPAAGGVPLVHVDAYRLGRGADPRAEVDDLDLDASMDDSVTLVEWGEGMVEQLADAYLEVRIDRRDDEPAGDRPGPARRRLGRLDDRARRSGCESAG